MSDDVEGQDCPTDPPPAVALPRDKSGEPQAIAAPCSTCPWRKSSTAGGADIPRFDIDLMRGLRNTVGRGDEFRPIMACHGSACGAERSCVGYVYVEGYSNLAVRIQAMQGRIDFGAIDEACAELDLWPSFDVMLEVYEEAAEEAAYAGASSATTAEVGQ